MPAGVDKEYQKLVLARLSTLPAGISISVGSEGEFKKEDLLKHIEDYDEIGQKMIEIDKRFLTALKEGKLFAE